jgi:hypothetical protein
VTLKSITEASLDSHQLTLDVKPEERALLPAAQYELATLYYGTLVHSQSLSDPAARGALFDQEQTIEKRIYSALQDGSFKAEVRPPCVLPAP